MTVIKIEGNVEWKCFRASEEHWVAVCDPLGLTVQSDTWANLMEDIANTLDLMLKDLLELNELERFFAERGWHPVGHIPSQPADVWFDIPFMIRTAEYDSQGQGSQGQVHQ